MYPAISLIAWGNTKLNEFFDLIKKNGVNSFEVAPSQIFNDPMKVTDEVINEFKKTFKKENINFIGFHSLLYKKKELQLFESESSRKETLNYLKKLIEICGKIGGNNLVFGSPNNRKLFNRKYDECLSQSHEDFWKLAEIGKKFGVNFCIEPLAKSISEFIQSNDEGASLVKSVNHPNFRLHIDTKTIFENKEDVEILLKKNISICEHIHISEIGLSPLSDQKFNHRAFSNNLKKFDYKKFLSIEMVKDEKNKIQNIKKSINFLKKNYFS